MLTRLFCVRPRPPDKCGASGAHSSRRCVLPPFARLLLVPGSSHANAARHFEQSLRVLGRFAGSFSRQARINSSRAFGTRSPFAATAGPAGPVLADERLHRRLALEDEVARHQEVDHAAERVDVGPVVDLPALEEWPQAPCRPECPVCDPSSAASQSSRRTRVWRARSRAP
jgi:hypothetical protein